MARDNSLVFRSYQAHDLDAITALDALCFEPPFRFSIAAMRRFVETTNAWTLIAESGNTLAGFLIVHLELVQGRTVGYVVTIDVTQTFRRTGLGRRLLSKGEGWVASSGGEAMLLHVYMKNSAAIAFYEQLGYQSVGVVSGFYGRGIDAMLYSKPLKQK
jgi:ribosomal-protein-alanine N-acetyltransferase